jgi:UDP-N-acetylglucosamine 2-epimerase
MNRKVADAVSGLHFAPTDLARRHLRAEGVDASRIFVTGNTGIDALHLALARLEHDGARRSPIIPSQLDGRRYVLITAHRRENFGAPLEQICRAVAAVAKIRPGIHFVYPVHLNPNVQQPVQAALACLPNVHLLPPVDYGDLLFLLKGALFVVTDSGGLQEEAPALGKPVLVLRNVTERPEAVKAGTARLIGTEERDVRRWILRLLDDEATYQRMASAVNPYGDGFAADRTSEAIRYFFGLRPTRPAEFRAGLSVGPTADTRYSSWQRPRSQTSRTDYQRASSSVARSN